MWRTLGAALLAVACAGPTTTVVGDARDAKGGAVVVEEGGGRVVYVDGMDRWPDAVSGKRVAVTGRLVERGAGGEPLVNDAGEHSAGAVGPRWVVEGARWEPR